MMKFVLKLFLLNWLYRSGCRGQAAARRSFGMAARRFILAQRRVEIYFIAAARRGLF